MSDTTTEAGERPVHLLANSYDLQDLEKASAEAAKAKADDRDAAYGAIARDAALNKDVIEGREKPALPEGTRFETIEGADGQEVEMAVAIPDGEEASADGDTAKSTTTTRRRRATPETDDAATA